MQHPNQPTAPLTAFYGLVPQAIPFAYVVTYPRSGTGWVQKSLCHLLGAQLAEVDSPTLDKFNFPLLSGASVCFGQPELSSSPAIVKTHMNYADFAIKCPQSKVVYVMRDGRDVLTSYYFFKKGKPHIDQEKNYFDQGEFLKFVEERAPEWRDHVLGWLTAPLNICVIAYEELKSDYCAGLSRVSEYIGLSTQHTIEQTRAAFVDNFQFDGRGARKGVVGGWRQYWSKDHKDAFKQHAGELLVKIGWESSQNW